METLPVWIFNFCFFSGVHIATYPQKSGLALFKCWKKYISLRLTIHLPWKWQVWRHWPKGDKTGACLLHWNVQRMIRIKYYFQEMKLPTNITSEIKKYSKLTLQEQKNTRTLQYPSVKDCYIATTMESKSSADCIVNYCEW